MSIHDARTARDTLRGIPTTAAALVETVRRARLAAARRGDIGPNARRDLEQRIRAEGLAKIAEIEAQHRDAAATFQAEIRRTRRAPNKMGTDEAAGWERLRSSIDGASRKDPRLDLAAAAMARLERAAADGDLAMLRAGRTMLTDYLDGHGATLPAEWQDKLDVIAGGGDVPDAVGLDMSGRKGIPWTAQAVAWAKAEIDGSIDSATVIPTWDGGTIGTGAAPDYAKEASASNADLAASLVSAGYAPNADGTLGRVRGGEAS
jgi:hypothetical protein